MHINDVLNTNYENDKNKLKKCKSCEFGISYEMQFKLNGEKVKEKICV